MAVFNSTIQHLSFGSKTHTLLVHSWSLRCLGWRLSADLCIRTCCLNQGMLEADEAFFKEHGEPLFSSHMLDLQCTQPPNLAVFAKLFLSQSLLSRKHLKRCLLFECVDIWFDLSPYRLQTHWIEVWGTRWGEHWDLRQVPRICSMSSFLCRPVTICEVLEAHGTNENDSGNSAWTSTCHEQSTYNTLVEISEVPRAHVRPTSLRKWRLASPVAWKMVLTTAELPRSRR